MYLMMMGHDSRSDFCSVLASIFTFCHSVEVQYSSELDGTIHVSILVEVVVDGIFVIGDRADPVFFWVSHPLTSPDGAA